MQSNIESTLADNFNYWLNDVLNDHKSDGKQKIARLISLLAEFIRNNKTANGYLFDKYHDIIAIIDAVNGDSFNEDQCITIIDFLFSQGLDVNFIDYIGETLLLSAIKYGYFNITKWLLSKGADPNIKKNRNDVPLTLIKAFRLKFDVLKFVKLLCEFNVSIPLAIFELNFKNKDVETYLHEIRETRENEEVKTYLRDLHNKTCGYIRAGVPCEHKFESF